MDTPLGKVVIKATADHIVSVLFLETKNHPAPADPELDADHYTADLMNNCKIQLQEYFDGKRFTFDLPLQQTGSPFQQKVWDALLTIPYGKTISYLELSKRIGNVKAIRAVGTTNGKNQLSILVPCHRVIGTNGDLVGYSGDLSRKKWLLGHEGRYANGIQSLF